MMMCPPSTYVNDQRMSFSREGIDRSLAWVRWNKQDGDPGSFTLFSNLSTWRIFVGWKGQDGGVNKPFRQGETFRLLIVSFSPAVRGTPDVWHFSTLAGCSHFPTDSQSFTAEPAAAPRSLRFCGAAASLCPVAEAVGAGGPQAAAGSRQQAAGSRQRRAARPGAARWHGWVSHGAPAAARATCGAALPGAALPGAAAAPLRLRPAAAPPRRPVR